jgi:hypothetical protein
MDECLNLDLQDLKMSRIILNNLFHPVNPVNPGSRTYSYFKAFTGFSLAAFIASELIVSTAMSMTTRLGMSSSQALKSI